MYRKSLIPLKLEVELNRKPPPWGGERYRKILVPLDRSKGAEDALAMAQELLAPQGEGILLHVIPPGKSRELGHDPGATSRQEDTERAKAMGYLRCVRSYRLEVLGRWRCEVVSSDSVPDAIADFAVREGVDLIAMYTHDRKGLARAVKRSIAEKVQQKGPVEVRVLRPRELVAK